MKKPIIFCAVVAFMLVFSTNVFAERMMFTHSGTGSGSIGGVEFTDASFTITGVGDTEDRLYSPDFPGVYWINHDSTSIVIENLGSFQFVSGTRTFVNNVNSAVGISHARPGAGFDLYDGPKNSIFADWDMQTPIGPVTGNDFMLVQWDNSPSVETDAGILVFDDQFNIAGSFEAFIVPEPSSFVLLLTAAFLMIFLKPKN